MTSRAVVIARHEAISFNKNNTTNEIASPDEESGSQ